MRSIFFVAVVAALVGCAVKPREYQEPTTGKATHVKFINRGNNYFAVWVFEDARDCGNRFLGPTIGNDPAVLRVPSEHGVAFQLSLQEGAGRVCRVMASFAPQPPPKGRLPVGAASKEHGAHMPLGTDLRQAEYYKGRVLLQADVVIPGLSSPKGPWSPDPKHPRYGASGVYGDATLATVAKGRILLEGMLDEIEDLRQSKPPEPVNLFGRLAPSPAKPPRKQGPTELLARFARRRWAPALGIRTKRAERSAMTPVKNK